MLVTWPLKNILSNFKKRQNTTKKKKNPKLVIIYIFKLKQKLGCEQYTGIAVDLEALIWPNYKAKLQTPERKDLK